MCFTALVSLRAPAQQSNWGPAAGTKPAFSVVYTGRLFGYFRYPDEQSTDESGCPSVADTALPVQVAMFRAAVEKFQAGTEWPRVFVSMGDNFAPELLARAMRNRMAGTPYQGQIVAKDLFMPGPHGRSWYATDKTQPDAMRARSLEAGRVPADNVACFMRLVGVNAVVPGQEDFYFGPERLRELARFLAEPGSEDYAPVQMLAANLSISSTVRNPPPSLPSGALPKDVQQALAPSSDIEIQLPGTIMPWLRSVVVKGNSPQATLEAVYDCLAARTDPSDFKLPNTPGNECVQLENEGGDRDAYLLQKATRPSPDFVSEYYTLDPGDNHALCVQHEEKEGRVLTCKLFSVQYPFFQYRPGSSGTTPKPYYLSPEPQGGVAVFGVLDPSLAGYIGEFDDTWMNVDRRFDTHIAITDPIEAVRQELQLCAADQNCVNRRKILLAQMPYYEAMQVGAKIKAFDAIISQPDPQHATGDENTSRTLGPQTQPYLLTPGFAFDTSRKNPLSLNLRSVDVYLESGANGERKQFLASKVYDPAVEAPLRAHVTQPAVHALEAGAARIAGQANPLGSAKNYEDLALTTMQQFCDSDIALLQHRDVFTEFEKATAYWPAGNYGVQQLLEEALWKGDFAFCLAVKGSTIKKMLAESAKFDQEDANDLSLAVERGRGLSTLGITTDPSSGAPVVRGEVVNDNRLYGVAMTDYLAFGDTGYPELSSEAVLPRVRVTSLKSLNRLTGLACERLPESVTQGKCQADQIDASQYFDAIAQMPPDTSPGLSVLRELRIWATHPVQPQPVSSTFLSKNDGTPEGVVEHRGLWWLTLENVSLEYDLSFIRGSDKTIPANFSGINTFSQLSTPESSQLGLWTRIRGGYSFPRFIDFYASGEERYTRAAVRESDASGNGNFGPYQLTLMNNAVRAEFGILSKPLAKRVPIRALVSENLFTQVTDPFDQLTAAIPCVGPNCAPGATTLATLDLGKNFLVMTRVGARLQNNQSWFEAGREYGENIGIPIGYRLQDPGRTVPFSCALSGNYSLSSCVSADPLFTTQSKVLPNLENQGIAGWFMDFHTAAPIYRSKLQLTIDSYGEKFDKRADDTSFNTRFYEDLTVALNVPLWGNLIFAPQVEAFFFQNKVVPGENLLTNHYTFVTSSLKLQYGFDWHRGVGWIRALRYPNGVSTAASPVATAP